MRMSLAAVIMSTCLSANAYAAALLDAADDMLGGGRWEYFIENPQTGFASWYTGDTLGHWDLADNGDNTLSAVLTFAADGRNLVLEDRFFYRYQYDAASDVAFWGFFPTDGQATKRLLMPVVPVPGAPLVDSGYDIYLQLWTGCLAYCDNPYPDVPQLPLPAAFWQLGAALSAMVAMTRFRRRPRGGRQAGTERVGAR